MSLDVRLDAFEGPMELLLNLIGKNQINIYDIPIADLTRQYLEHVRALTNLEPEPLSEFCVMAATLIEIKSKVLLPPRRHRDKDAGEEEDPRDALVERLLEYKRFKEASGLFADRALIGEQCFFGAPDEELLKRAKLVAKAQEVLAVDLMEGIDTKRLFEAFAEVIMRRDLHASKEISLVSIEQDGFTVEERMEHIEWMLLQHSKLDFLNIFPRNVGRMEIIVTFIALLELVKQRVARVRQEEGAADILILSCSHEGIYSG